jgi:tRNA-2-methylthio-N6-dimethylallyladenosine synthase
MNRGYSREDYMKRIVSIREIIPDCGISTDIISGFCNETEEEHTDTLSLMEWAEYDFAYMFKYSERPGTSAAKKFEDDISENIKSKRLQEVVDLQLKLSAENNKKDINKVHRVLVEGFSKKSKEFLSGRNTQNKVVVFPKENLNPGDYVNVLVTECTAATLIGKVIAI